jgi:pimeloyl-ACP methyl ester carboxylesterase
VIWIGAIIGLYMLLLLAIGWASIHPYRIPIFFSPGAMGASQEEVSFPSADALPLRGWWVEASGTKAVVILAHGYVMNRSELAPVAGTLAQHGISSLVFDFRAHGFTKVGKSTLGWNERHDIRGAVEYARSRVPGAKIVVVGSSMGSAAAALAWSEDPNLLDGAVLDSCYSRLSSATLGWWRFLGGKLLMVLFAPTVLVAAPLVGVNPFKVDISKALERLSGKNILFMHGDCDDLALPDEARRNMAAVGESARVVWFSRCGHSEGRWLYPDQYYSALFEYLRELGIATQSAMSADTQSNASAGKLV